MAQNYIKDPEAVLDYSIDWADWLVSDTISTSTWDAEDGITVDDDDSTATTTTVWLSGGTLGARYLVTNHIVTAAGREDDRTITIRVQER